MRSETHLINSAGSIESATWAEGFTTNTPRPYRRARFSMPVSVHSDESRRATVTNLCASGAVLTMTDAPDPGEIVEIEFATPVDKMKLRLLGKVHWREDHDASADVGITFQNLGADGLELLRDFVDARST